MIFYLIKSGLCLAAFLAFYHWFLEREKRHQFNRFYLLGSIIVSFLIPLIIIYVERPESMVATFIENQQIPTITFEQEQAVDYINYLLIGYLLVSGILFIRFINNLYNIYQKIQLNTIISHKKAKIVLVPEKILPHTFWNYIFINKNDFQEGTVESELFTHELTHVTQKHTIDIIIVELLQIALWFNPFLYPLKKAVKLNHEFLADDKVIASHQDISKYQYLLIDKAAWKDTYYLASNFNYSLTKKRLLMMKTQESKSIVLMKKLAIVPLLGGLFLLFANRVEAQSTEAKEQTREITKAQMEEYNQILKESENTQMFRLSDLKRAQYLYQLMSEKQQKLTKNIYDLIPPPPPPPPLPPSIEEIDETLEGFEERKVQIIEVSEGIEEKEVEIIETPQGVEVIEVIKSPHVKKIKVVKNLHKNKHKERKEHEKTYKKMVELGAEFYLNGDKVSAEKAKKYFLKRKNEVKTINIMKSKKGQTKVKIRTE